MLGIFSNASATTETDLNRSQSLDEGHARWHEIEDELPTAAATGDNAV